MLIRLPGMIDTHVHLRDPGAIHKEDFYTGTAAALAGGVVCVSDMPNNLEPTVSDEALDQKEKIADKKAVCDYGFLFGATGEGNTNEYQKVKKRVVGLKVYMDQTTGPLLVKDDKVLEKTFATWPKEKPILVHAERETVKNAINLAKRHGNKLHCCHVSLKEELIWIKEAKEQGLPVTCEVTPHHLFLTSKDAKTLGPYGKVKPPLRSKKDVDFFWQNLSLIDIIATDHAPHTKKEKESNNPPYGLPGLETVLPLLFTAVNDGRLSLEELVRLTFKGPAKIFNLPADNQTYIEVDMRDNYIIQNENLFTKCGWSSFSGWQVKGRIRKVVIRGKEVYRDGELLAQRGYGRNKFS